jgi:hypothetical protein
MRAIQDNTTTATARRVFLLIFDDTAACAPWAGSVTGIKGKLSINGGSEVDTNADVVRVGGALHYVPLTQAEVDQAVGDRLHVRVPGASGRRESLGAADIYSGNVFSLTTAAGTATAVRSELTTELGRIDAPVSGALTGTAFTTATTTLRQALSVGARFGGAVSGGTSIDVPVYDAGNPALLLGTVTIYRDADKNVVGQSALVPA